MKLASRPDILPLGEAVTHWYRSRRRRLVRLCETSKRKAKQNEPDLQHDLAFNGGEERDCEEELAQCGDD